MKIVILLAFSWKSSWSDELIITDLVIYFKKQMDKIHGKSELEVLKSLNHWHEMACSEVQVVTQRSGWNHSKH